MTGTDEEGDATTASHPTPTDWRTRALLAALAYPLIGIGLSQAGALSTTAGPGAQRAARLAAWGLSAVLLLAHVAWERLRAAAPPPRAALRAAAAVAAGGFLLAVWVLVHGRWTGAPQSRLAPLSLVAFPILTGIPAFLVGLGVATLLGTLRRTGRGE